MAPSKEERIRSANEEIIGAGNLDAVEEFFASDYVVHSGGKEYGGTAFVRKFIGLVRAAIPNVRVGEIEFLCQTGDKVAWRRTLSGTHKADMMGIPASGKKVVWRDMLVTRFDGEKIAEEWTVSELAEQLLLKQPRR